MNLLLAGPDHLGPYLAVAAALFAIGVLACVTRRNAVGFLIGIELMLNAAALNFTAFSRFRSLEGSGVGGGQAMALFIIALAAAESAVALALVYSAYRTFRDADLAATTTLRG